MLEISLAKSTVTESGVEGESQTIEVTDARGARRVGLIWMLGISTGSAAMILIGMWAFNSHHMNSAGQNNNPPPVASAKKTATSPSATTSAGQAPH